jgi:hypothetical protein
MAEGFRNTMTGFGSRLTPQKSPEETLNRPPAGLLCCQLCSDNMAESSAMFVTGS